MCNLYQLHYLFWGVLRVTSEASSVKGSNSLPVSPVKVGMIVKKITVSA